MADSPQTSSPQDVQRDDRGRVMPGSSLNPGGMPQWLADVRKELASGSMDAARYLNRVVRGEETAFLLSKNGETVQVDLGHKDRIAAAKVICDYTIPKPRPVDEEGNPDVNAWAQLARELLMQLATNGPIKPKP